MTKGNAFLRLALAGWLASTATCGADGSGWIGEPQVDDMPEVADDSIARAISGNRPFGTRLITTANLNLRTGPSTSYRVRAVMPLGETVRVVRSTTTNGWYNINWDGIVGWASGSYMNLSLTPSSARQKATARALSVWGFSYHWGQGDWNPRSQSPGSCSGSCPNCSHSGSYGADCSGMVAKAWVVPPSNTPLTKVSHPYSTQNFRYGTNYWTKISRSNAREGDAMVYRNSANTAGHVFYVYGGDPWGSIRAVECKGCSSGCLYNVRTAGSSYVAIRRNGY